MVFVQHMAIVNIRKGFSENPVQRIEHDLGNSDDSLVWTMSLSDTHVALVDLLNGKVHAWDRSTGSQVYQRGSRYSIRRAAGCWLWNSSLVAVLGSEIRLVDLSAPGRPAKRRTFPWKSFGNSRLDGPSGVHVERDRVVILQLPEWDGEEDQSKLGTGIQHRNG